jgi:ribose 5-phosphate isomerase
MASSSLSANATRNPGYLLGASILAGIGTGSTVKYELKLIFHFIKKKKKFILFL